MPDIDLDFQDDKRHLLLEYAAGRYGRDKVAQIITFGTLGARAAIRDVGRVMDIPLPEVDRVAKLVPNIPGKPVTLPETLETVTAFREIYEGTPYLKELIDTASRLEGVIRNAGTHAAGVIITDRPIIEYIPLHRPTGAGQENTPIGGVTQFEMQVLESLGLLKIDFLGLSTLTVMERACELIRRRHGVQLTIHTIPLDDPATYELLGRGDVQGVFQVEGAGMRRYLMEMKPRALAHVTAMVALYRPGPMEFIPSYIRRMRQQEAVAYRHSALRPILEETYGITVYQEQIMYTAMNLAGYTAAEADNLRKAVAKKKAEALHQERDRFVAGCVGREIPEQTANEIFDDWEAFARYGFPKGHAADYAVICVQTAYLKTHYPVEYMAALMSVFKGDTDKVALYIADSRRMGFDVLPPDVNAGGLDFEIEDQPNGKVTIRYGLGAVKNVGVGAAQVILEARRRSGLFQGLHDFAQRVDLRQVGKRALESLIRVGALDGFGDRMSLIDSIDRIMSHSTSHFRAADVGQLSLFGASSGVREEVDLPPSMLEVSRRQLLSWERELLGVYVSEHPLTPYLDQLGRVVTHFSAELSETPHEQGVCVAGEVTHIRPYQTRSGKPMGFVTLEDLQGSIEVVVFSRTWAQVSPWLESGIIVLVRGKVDNSRGEPKVLADEITTEISIVEPKAPLRSAPVVQELEMPPDDLGWMPAEEVLEPVLIEDVLARDGLPPVAPATDVGLDPLARTLAEPPPAPLLMEGLPGEEVPDWDSVDETTVQASPDVAPVSPADRQMLTLILRSSGDRERDARRLRRVHGLLTSSPGQDRFAFRIFEASRSYYLEFPNSTTGYTPELHRQLLQLLGTGSVLVEPLRIQ
jgi:DNA polymerase-3 subunit alpha